MSLAPPASRPGGVSPRSGGTRCPVTPRRCNRGKDRDRATAGGGRQGHRARHGEARRDAGGVGGGVHHVHRSEEHTSELQSLAYLVCRLLLEKKKHRTSPQ